MSSDQPPYRNEDYQNPYASPQETPYGPPSYVTRTGEELNPWFSIWTQPRATIRQIIETDPQRMVILLACVAGVGEALDRASIRSLGDQFPLGAILLLGVVVGAISGLVELYLMGWLVRVTGNWIGGVANSEQVRAALAWSGVPAIWAMLLWLPELALFGEEMFTSATPRMDSNFTLAAGMIAFGLVEMVIGIWQFIVMLKCVGEVHQFSAWAALGASILAALLILAVVVPVVVLFFLLL